MVEINMATSFFGENFWSLITRQKKEPKITFNHGFATTDQGGKLAHETLQDTG